LKRIAIGLLIGAAIGIPLSYYFQPGWLRALVSLPGYIEMICRSTLDSLKGKGGGGGNPALVVKATIAITAILGAFTARAIHRSPARA
jgi:hypothetical protein